MRALSTFRRLALAASVLLLGAPALAQPAPAAPQVRTLAEFASGAFLENLHVEADGAIVFTHYFDKTLMVRRPDGQVQVLARLEAHPVGLARLPDGYLLSAHGAPFTSGAAFVSTNQVLEVGLDGAVRRTTPAPKAQFLNGVLIVRPGVVLIADSIAGTIWRYRSDAGLEAWLSAPALAPDPQVSPFRPGANGLKLRDRTLFVSNSSRGEISTIALGPKDEPGPVERYAGPGPVDDFVIARDGALFGATHGETLIAVAPDRSSRSVLAHGCDACTAVAFADASERRLIVLTTGGLLEGKTAPARVLEVTLPDSPRR
jgi:hypothetical protein